MILGALFMAVGVSSVHSQSCSFEHCSPGLNGGASNAGAIFPALSFDGRFVVFESWSSNLVPGDTNGWRDVFRYDRSTGAMLRVSVSTGGGEANQVSSAPAVSDDGRWVAFESSAELDAGDMNDQQDIYLHDTATGTTVWVSRGILGVQPDDFSVSPAISGDGRFVAFSSWASNLIPGDTNQREDVFVFEVATGSLERVNLAPDGSQALSGHSKAPDLSTDGRFVSFQSEASNLVAGGDLNGTDTDVFVHDRATGQTTVVSLDPNGVQPVPGWAQEASISGDGRFVAYQDFSGTFSVGAYSFGHILVHDRVLRQNTIVSVDDSGATGDGISYSASISDDGRFVAFGSQAKNLVPADLNGWDDVFVHDRVLGTTRRVSETPAGVGGNQRSQWPGISGDGRVVGFYSGATNLVPGLPGLTFEILVQDCGVPPPASFCPAVPNSQGCTPSLTWTGTPSAAAGNGFVLSGTELINGKVGLLLYSIAGWSPKPYFGGTLCLEAPLGRTALSKTGGTVGPEDCSGTLSVDFNAYAASGADPALAAGQAVYAQFVSRDPASLGTLSSTDALAFTPGP